MSTILDNISFSCYQRPTYTNYELSAMIREKRLKMGLSIEQFASFYNTTRRILIAIEMCSRSFNYSLYKLCSDMLEIPLNDLLKFDVDTKPNVNNISKQARETIDVANEVFHEMVMMHKIHTR